MSINWLDQSLHLVVGGLLAGVTAYFVTWWAGLMLSMTVAVVREFAQHPWRCGEGCRMDLLYWGIGSLVGVSACLFVQGGLA